MSEEWKPKPDRAFESFMHYAEHETRMDNSETPHQHAVRLLSEIKQDVEAGIQSQEEAIAILAKIDIVFESTKEPAIVAEARQLQSDINNRYRDLSKLIK